MRKQLLSNATNANDIVDADVEAKVNLLTSQIQKIVEDISGDKRNLKLSDEDWVPIGREILRWDRTKYKIGDISQWQKYWLRSQIFHWMITKIIHARVYGVSVTIEGGLGDFEKALSAFKVSGKATPPTLCSLG